MNTQEIFKQVISFVSGMSTTTIGFFLALYFNKKIEIKKEKETYKVMIKGILSEIKNNQITIKNSFMKFIDGIIFNELRIEAIQQYITNNIFLKYVDNQNIDIFHAYIVNIKLCNEMKAQLQTFRLSSDQNEWEPILQNVLNNQIIKTENIMIELDKTLINSC